MYLRNSPLSISESKVTRVLPGWSQCPRERTHLERLRLSSVRRTSASSKWPRSKRGRRFMVNITAYITYIYAHNSVCVCTEKTKALLFQGANPTVDTGKVLGLAVQIPQNGRQICAHNATNGPSCAGDQGQLVFSSDGVLSAIPRTNGITGTTIAAGNGSSGSHAAGGRQHTGLLSYFTSSHRAAQGGVQCPGGSGGREVCCGCRQQCVAVGVQQCDHCEKSVCGNCCTQCCVCQSLFCNFCTVLK